MEEMIRVLPRDAFNDANLLKCIGRITLLIEDRMIEGLKYYYDGSPFNIQQNPDDGSTFVANIRFEDEEGNEVFFYRPMNSRDPWPLEMYYKDDEYYAFSREGDWKIDKNKFKRK